MQAQILQWIASVGNILAKNSQWMAWNLFLAVIPLALSVWLFRRKKVTKRSPAWWLMLLVFIAFLPNAPYILTDIIHLIHDIRTSRSVWNITLILIPLYTLFIISGFEAYVISLINLGYYLKQQQQKKFIVWIELLIHALCAGGIYLGRFLRFNSWDLITQFDTLTETVISDVIGKLPLAIISITFLIITGLYWLLKQLTLALLRYFKFKTKHSKNFS